MSDLQLFTRKLLDLNVDVNGVSERFMDNMELYRSCLMNFLSGDDVSRLGDCIKALDYGTAFEIAHSMKGLSANLGLTHLYVSVCILVEALRGANYANLSAEYTDVLTQVAFINEANLFED